MTRSSLSWALCLALAPSLAGCGATDAYVYKYKEFDRNEKGFNRPITDRTEVTICYNGVGTSDGRIAAMAQEECGKFGKIARAQGEGFGACPLFVPIEAHFACLPVAVEEGGKTAEPSEDDAASDFFPAPPK